MRACNIFGRTVDHAVRSGPVKVYLWCIPGIYQVHIVCRPSTFGSSVYSLQITLLASYCLQALCLPLRLGQQTQFAPEKYFSWNVMGIYLWYSKFILGISLSYTFKRYIHGIYLVYTWHMTMYVVTQGYTSKKLYGFVPYQSRTLLDMWYPKNILGVSHV